MSVVYIEERDIPFSPAEADPDPSPIQTPTLYPLNTAIPSLPIVTPILPQSVMAEPPQINFGLLSAILPGLSGTSIPPVFVPKLPTTAPPPLGIPSQSSQVPSIAMGQGQGNIFAPKPPNNNEGKFQEKPNDHYRPYPPPQSHGRGRGHQPPPTRRGTAGIPKGMRGTQYIPMRGGRGRK